MQCEQLIRLIKDWYVRVKQETMAPARMMQFVDNHISECACCREDSELSEEVEKIREFILPESKIPKAARSEGTTSTPEISPDEDEYEGTEIDDDEDDEFAGTEIDDDDEI